MAFYLVRYSLSDDNSYKYPELVAGVVWKSTVYHYSEQSMIGETDAVVETDGKQVTALTPEKAQKLIKQYQVSHPKGKDLPSDLRHASRK